MVGWWAPLTSQEAAGGADRVLCAPAPAVPPAALQARWGRSRGRGLGCSVAQPGCVLELPTHMTCPLAPSTLWTPAWLLPLPQEFLSQSEYSHTHTHLLTLTSTSHTRKQSLTGTWTHTPAHTSLHTHTTLTYTLTCTRQCMSSVCPREGCQGRTASCHPLRGEPLLTLVQRGPSSLELGLLLADIRRD